MVVAIRLGRHCRLCYERIPCSSCCCASSMTSLRRVTCLFAGNVCRYLTLVVLRACSLTHSLCRWRVAAGAKPVDAELLGAVRKIFAPVDSELVCSDLEHLSLSNAIGTPDFTRCHTCISLIEPAYSSGRYCSGFGRREWETVALGQ